MKTKLIYTVLFLVVTFILSEKTLLGQVEENVEIEHLNIYELQLTDKSRNDYIIILMNKSSQLLVDGIICTIDEVENTVISNFQNKTSIKLDLNASNLLKKYSQETRIYVQKETRTSQEDFNLLVKKLSATIAELQDFYSNKVFSNNYLNLNTSNKEKISSIIKPKIYIATDKKMGNVQQEHVRVVDSVERKHLIRPERPIVVIYDTYVKEFTIPVNEDIPELKLLFGAHIRSGVITFTIYDPVGKKQENFSLKPAMEGYYHISKEVSEQGAIFTGGRLATRGNQVDSVGGTFSASYSNPIQGTWKIIVTVENAEGHYIIYQEYKSNY